jgi:adenylate cyclase, class 2
MLEIEIKAYCDDHNDVVEKIKSLGGKLVKIVEDKDIYYKHPSRDFVETDEAFRIRIEDNITLLTYKGPKIGGRSKTRFERELVFNGLDAMKEILDKLGFTIAGEVNKVRTYYSVKDIEICLDSVDGLGDFVELEIKGDDRVESEKILFDTANILGLTRFERKSYLELALEK